MSEVKFLSLVDGHKEDRIHLEHMIPIHVFTPDYGSPILFGDYGDVPVTGDWTGDGITKIGVFRPKDAATQLSTFYLQDITPPLAFATPTDWPIIGDWHGDGRDDIGIYRIGEFHLYSRNTGQSTQVALGLDGDMPLTGDWNKDGKVKLVFLGALIQQINFILILALLAAKQNMDHEFGDQGDIPIVGDWNAGGSDKIGVFRPSNGIFYPNSNIPDISSFDTTPPVVYYFYIPSVSVILNNPFTISYSVSDSGGSGLNRVELWRANDNNGTPSGWVELKRNSHTGNGPITSTFTDAPSSVGVYWYGVHVVDNATNWNDERIQILEMFHLFLFQEK